jgi:hypothetical protein
MDDAATTMLPFRLTYVVPFKLKLVWRVGTNCNMLPCIVENRKRILCKHWMAGQTAEERLKAVQTSQDGRDFRLTPKDVQNAREHLNKLQVKQDLCAESVRKRVRFSFRDEINIFWNLAALYVAWP